MVTNSSIRYYVRHTEREIVTIPIPPQLPHRHQDPNFNPKIERIMIGQVHPSTCEIAGDETSIPFHLRWRIQKHDGKCSTASFSPSIFGVHNLA
jgi:hypothetical protein